MSVLSRNTPTSLSLEQRGKRKQITNCLTNSNAASTHHAPVCSLSQEISSYNTDDSLSNSLWVLNLAFPPGTSEATLKDQDFLCSSVPLITAFLMS